MIIVGAAGGLCIALLLAGCVSDPLGGSAAPTPDLGMAGRWMLAAPNAPSCGMIFAAAPGAHEGKVAPEGGCPGRFFTSRRWKLEQAGLVIIDNENQPLATLSYADGHFDGQSNAGMPVTLTRDAPPN
jgi:hypothetical protein